MINKFGEKVYTDEEAANILYYNPRLNLHELNLLNVDQYNNAIKDLFLEIPSLIPYKEPDITIEEYDKLKQNKWQMPDEYKQMNIAEYLFNLCECETEKQRVAEELLEFGRRDLLDVLKFLKYFVDTLRENNIVWGVGRGSSVASFVLYLIGVHKINSISYQLDASEFFKS